MKQILGGKVIIFVINANNRYFKRWVPIDHDGKLDLTYVESELVNEYKYSFKEVERFFDGDFDRVSSDGVSFIKGTNTKNPKTSPLDRVGCATTLVVSLLVGVCAIAYLIINMF